MRLLKCLIFDPYCGASEQMILGALLGCGADEWRVKSAVEGLCGAPLKVEGYGNGQTLAVISERDAKVWPGFLTGEEALGKLNVMHENQPIRIDAMNIVRRILEVRGGPGKDSPGISIASVAMIAGICTAYDDLGRPQIRSTPVAMGGGMIDTECGKMPVPRPEVLSVLNGSKLLTQGGPFDGELLTLEAAAILAYYVKEAGRYYPEHRLISAGYGKGYFELPVPNLLRAVLCEVDDALIGDRIELLETNVDDVTGEVLGNLIEELLAMGARDVSILPATMKKGRSGQLIRVVAKAEDGPALSRRIMLETGTLGVRVIPVKHRYIAKREIKVIKVTIENNEYNMRFKVASDMNGTVLDLSVEYDDAKMIARELSIPLKTVMRKAETQAWQKYDASGGKL
ncbi:LarC family nickel insertion protein [Methanocella arvoryzae]|uniref:LarC family nickel insertion protein n=1 Tax=Methanocella arvoryzae TaxID=1175445 RepID=UPI001E4BBF30|nr:LarC family nickel insertion protein [Methanocella arvoryzae]